MNPLIDNIEQHMSNITPKQSDLDLIKGIKELIDVITAIGLMVLIITIIGAIISMTLKWFNPFYKAYPNQLTNSTPKTVTPQIKPSVKINHNVSSTLTDHLTPNYQTDAIGLATIVNDFVADKTLVAGIQIDENCRILAKKSIKKDDIANQQQQQLQNALTIIRDAVKADNVKSLELIFTDPIIKDYAINLRKDSRIALQYAQEINALSKQIDIIFTNINAVPANKIAKLNHYVTKH